METTSTTPATPATQTADSYVPMDQYIADARTALINAQLPDIAPLLQKRSYPTTLLQAKLAELTALDEMSKAQTKEYGEQFGATKAYADSLAELKTAYMEHLELARMVFKKDTAAKTTLGLKGDRKQSNSGFNAQALLFYTGALQSTDYQAALATKGIEVAELQAGKDGFEHLANLAATQTKETGEAQKATADRDKAYDTFSEWMNEFYATAAIALRKTPQLMEKMGLVQK